MVAQFLAHYSATCEIEIFKTQHSLILNFMKEMFVTKNNQNALKNEHSIKLPRPQTTTFRENAFIFLGESYGMNYH